jgi:hypothetical protein
MPSDFNFDLRLQRARDEINEALGQRPQQMPMQQPSLGQQIMQNTYMQANPQMQMAGTSVPMGGGVSANAQYASGQLPSNMRGLGVGASYNSPNFSANLSYNPQQKFVGANMRVPFQEGGLATSLRSDPVHHERDVDFINTRNQHMRELAGMNAYAKGGGAWTRKEGQNPEGGLNAAGRASLKAQGHDIKPPVSAKQAKKSPKAAARRKSFCARMSGMPGPMKDDNGKPTRKALSLRKWDC